MIDSPSGLQSDQLKFSWNNLKNVLKLLSLLIHLKTLAQLMSSAGLLTWSWLTGHFSKTKHDKYLEKWAESQYMHLYIV